MAILFDWYENPKPSDKEKERKHYTRVLNTTVR